jgi:DNA-binding winged helix-turn-helix (wHTH) protein
MGIIEDSIFTIYKKALEEGDMPQAENAVQIMSFLRKKIDIDGFIDHSLHNRDQIVGNFFNPFPYRHHSTERLIIIDNNAILLTDLENKLLSLFSQHQTHATNIHIISHEKIKTHLWGDKKVSPNALRITINRLRKKIEPNPQHPVILINFYRKGYLFVAKEVTD